ERTRQRIQLGLHGATRIGGELSYRDDAGGAGMRPMRRGTGVVDENVAERGKLLSKVVIVLFLARMNPGVFKTENVAVFHGSDRGFGFGPDTIFGKGDRPLDEPGHFGRDRAE